MAWIGDLPSVSDGASTQAISPMNRLQLRAERSFRRACVRAGCPRSTSGARGRYSSPPFRARWQAAKQRCLWSCRAALTCPCRRQAAGPCPQVTRHRAAPHMPAAARRSAFSPYTTASSHPTATGGRGVGRRTVPSTCPRSDAQGASLEWSGEGSDLPPGGGEWDGMAARFRCSFFGPGTGEHAHASVLVGGGFSGARLHIAFLG